MKKFLTGIFLFFMTGALLIAATPLDNGTSALSQTTFGLFSNEMDAASTVDESINGPGFTDLNHDYLFTGISGNLNQYIVETAGNMTSFVLGYYRAADMPWAVFADMDFTNADTSSAAQQTSNADGSITTEYQFPGYNIIQSELTFLKDFKPLSAGVTFNLYLKNNRAATSNYTEENTNTNTDTTVYNEGGSQSIYTFTFPLYKEMEGKKHYAELGFRFNTTDSSSGTKTTVSRVKTENSVTDISRYITPSILYKLTMPMGNGLLIPYVDTSMVFQSSDYSTKNNTSGTNLTSKYTQDYQAGLNLTLGAAYQMDISPAAEWLDFKIRPEARYDRSSNSYMTREAIVSKTDGTTTLDTTRKGIENSTVSNELSAILSAGIEMKPDDWFIGFSMGSKATLSWDRTRTETSTGSTTDNETDIETENETSTQVKNTDWDSLLNNNVGFFIPLPDDYRLDFSLNGSNFFEFENVTLQLIVPIN